MDKPESEVRGMRLVAGYLILFVGTYWFVTGRVWMPFSETVVNAVAPETAMAARGADGAVTGPISDAYAVVSAIAYILGTAGLSGVFFAWNVIRHFFSATREWISGGEGIANTLTNKIAPTVERSGEDLVGKRLAALEFAMDAVCTEVNEHAKTINAHSKELERLEDVKTNRRGATS